MPEQQDKNEIKSVYSEACLNYGRLGENLREALKKFLDDAGIEYLGVYCRVKEFQSFYEKIERKNFKDPFIEIDDICGLRIVCYYPADLEKIAQIIENEFEVLESINKADLLDPDKFGYQSLHFIVKIKDEWSVSPNYRDLCDLKAEIQVRTILMHAWADIEHNLSYKKKEHIPNQFKRQLYRLSALFEIADEQFDSLRIQKDEYKDILSKNAIKIKRFDVNQELNLDSLQAFLDFYYPDREKNINDTTVLLDEIVYYNSISKSNQINIESLVNAYENHYQNLSKSYMSFDTYPQVGVMRLILDLEFKDYSDIANEFYEIFGLGA